MRPVMIILVLALALIVAFQTFGTALFADGGTRPVIHHGVPALGVWIALAAAGLAVLWLLFQGGWSYLGGVVALILLVLASHRISEDPVKNRLTDTFAMIPVASIPMPADATPAYQPDGVMMKVQVGAESMVTLRGFGPFAISVPGGGSPTTQTGA